MISREVLSRRLGVEGATVVVLGLAVTGRVAARVLAMAGANVIASDLRDDVGGIPGVDVETGSHARAERALAEAAFVVPSPGISPRSGLLAEAISRGVPIASELDLAQRVTDARVVGVTGTKGKTTVCRLVERILRGTGAEAFACGNNEVPFLEAAVEHPNAGVFVVEASSFRLYFCKSFHPNVAVMTNLAPDHLDWHESMADYRDAKSRIATHQVPGDLYLYPEAQPELADLAPDPGPTRAAFGLSRRARGAWIDGDEVVVSLPSEGVASLHPAEGVASLRPGGGEIRSAGAAALAQRGPHFALDAAAAAAASVFCGAGATDIEAGLAGFAPDPHRLEFVGTRCGVRYYDDSMATNPFAAVAAIRAFSEPVVLIAGGRKKVPDLSPLGAEAPRLRAVVAIGEATADVVGAFAGTGLAVETAATMQDAVRTAAARAESGDVVLLAPACASQDAYANYAERGDDFAKACRSLGVGM